MFLFPQGTNSSTGDVSQLLVANGDYSGDGTEVPDYSGKNHSFTLRGNAEVKQSEGLFLDGESWVELNKKYAFRATVGTLALWVKSKPIDASNGDAITPIFSQYYEKDAEKYNIVCAITDKGELWHQVCRGRGYLTTDTVELWNQITGGREFVSSASSSSAITIPSDKINFDEWFHIAFVKDNKYDAIPYKMYINGVKCDVKILRTDSKHFDNWAWLGGLWMDINDPDFIKYNIGFYDDDFTGGYTCIKFNGLIDNFAMYNRGLSESEMYSLYQSTRKPN
jgi:hypothetical protein